MGPCLGICASNAVLEELGIAALRFGAACKDCDTCIWLFLFGPVLSLLASQGVGVASIGRVPRPPNMLGLGWMLVMFGPDCFCRPRRLSKTNARAISRTKTALPHVAPAMTAMFCLGVDVAMGCTAIVYVGPEVERAGEVAGEEVGGDPEVGPEDAAIADATVDDALPKLIGLTCQFTPVIVPTSSGANFSKSPSLISS